MKLNYKRVFLVGLAFFLITMFWQCYDTIIPKILTDKFGMSQTLSGAFMAIDNVLALFMLPLFGALSDKCKSKRGRRTPFILIGTLVSCLLFVGMTYADNLQLKDLSAVSDTESKAALTELYEGDFTVTTVRGDAETVRIQDRFTQEEYTQIEMYDDDGKLTSDYQNYVAPARQAYAWQQTVSNPTPMILFIVLLLCTLISMSTFRSPAVALMPDVVPKPLRSKANAVINLMGTLAGVIVLILGMIFGTGKTENTLMSYTAFFAAVAGLMLIALTVFAVTVREPKWSADAAEQDSESSNSGSAEKEAGKKHKLTKPELRSLILLLASVALWFIGYNAVTSKYSVYAGRVLGLDYNSTLIIAVAVATVAFLPVGIISSKLGRRRTILGGIVILAAAFSAAYFINSDSPPWLMNCLFGLAGIGWASINVNSFPMVVELATGKDVGRYTGFYYAASMSAQIIAPILGGAFLDIQIRSLFPFGAVFVALSFVTMLFVRHGDAAPERKKSVLESFDAGDD